MLLSSCRVWNRRDRKRKYVQCVISAFRVLSAGDEARSLVTRLFPQGHNPTCHTGEFTKLNLFNVTGKFYHVTTPPSLTGEYRLRKLPLASLKQHGGPENKKKGKPRDALRLSLEHSEAKHKQ